MSRLIDADSHVAEPAAVWREYADPAIRDRVIQLRRSPQGRDELWIDGRNLATPNLNVAATCIPGAMSDPEKARAVTWDDLLPGSYDPHARIVDMDSEGIDATFLYPTLWLLYGDISDPEVAAASCRAYNDWIADFCKPYPERLFAVAPLPLQSVEGALAEMRRAVEKLGFRAVFIRPNPFNRRKLNDPAYDPLWRQASDMDVPVAIHGSFGTRMPSLGADRYGHDPFSFHMICHPFEMQAACMDIVCGGVLEKFRRLRVGFLESGVGWLGYWLDRMDGHYEKMRPYVPWLKRKPSEYFLERCFVSVDPEERTLAAMVGLGADRCILWGSDYPHFDCTFPGLVEEVTEVCSTLPEVSRRRILEENTARFYGLR